MTTGSEPSLAAQRESLREQLHTQRRLIAQHITPATTASRSRYPRSRTMRLLTQRPALMGRLLAGLGTLLVGARFVGSVTAALALVKMLRAASAADAAQRSSTRKMADDNILF